MIGQGRPLQIKYVGLLCIWLFAFLLPHHSIVLGDDSAEGLRLRLSFGGSQKAIWKGQIELPKDTEVRNVKVLGFQKDHSGRIYFKNNLLIVDLVEPTVYGGVEFEIEATPSDKINYHFKNIYAEGEDQTLLGELELDQLKSSNLSENVGDSTNRIFLERAPADDIKFISKRKSLVIKHGEPFAFGIAISKFCLMDFLREKNIEVKVHKVNQPKEIDWTVSRPIDGPGKLVEFEMDSELAPGVYDVLVQVKEQSRIPFSAPTILKQRIVQFVVVSSTPARPFADSEDNLELVYENLAGKTEKVFRGRFKPWEKINSSARNLIFKHLPLPAQGKGKREYFEIKPESLQLFPLTIDQTQSLLKLEVEFVSPSSLVADFVMFDRVQENFNYAELNSTTTKVNPSDDSLRKCELLFWNKSAHPVLMARSLKATGNLKITSIRVYRFEEKAQEFKLYTEQNRRLFTRFAADQFEKLLGAPKAKQKNNYFLDDWATFQTGGQRLVQLIKSAQYQGVILDVNQHSSGIFPSENFQFLPKSDTGVFSTEGRDPFRKDILELLFCQFDVNGLTLIPRIELPEFIAAFESADTGFQKNIRFMKSDGSFCSTYNFLDAHVQNYIAESVLEIVKRYSHHPSFGGICLNLGANGQLFINRNCGFNDKLVNDFLNQKPTKLVSAKSAADKRNLVIQSHAEDFNKFQTGLATKFLLDLNKQINSICGKNITVDLSDIYAAKGALQMFPKLRKGEKPSIHLDRMGVNRNELAKAGIGILMPSLSNASLNHSDRRKEFAIKEALPLDKAPKSHSMSRRIERRTETSNHKVAATAFENVVYHSSTPDSNRTFRRDLVEQLARNELLFFVDEFELGQRSLNSSSKRIWNTFCSLPNTVFNTVNKENSSAPVIVRSKSIGNKSYFYVINQSPWPTKVKIVFSSPLVNLRTVEGNFFDTLMKTESGGTLDLSLEPFDLVGCRSDQKELKISDVKYSFPESLNQSLAKQKDLLLAKIRFAKTPRSLTENSNPNFQTVDAAQAPAKWSFAKSDTFEVSTDSVDDMKSNRCLKINSLSDQKWGWVRSQHLNNNGTGRLSVLVSMRHLDNSLAPKIRLSVDGESNNQEYYRFGSFSSDKSLPAAARIEKEWKVFAVHFNDVPTDVSKLRVGLDVVGKGTILIDDIQVFDRWFDAQDKETLTKLVSLADHNISTGDFLKAHNLMNSYWPQFLRAYEVKDSDLESASTTNN